MQRFEKTNEMLTNCNALSVSRLKTVVPEFKKHIQLLLETKKDLDYIYKKIRNIKTKLSAQYPEAFAEAVRSSFAEECEEEDTKSKNKKNNAEIDITNRRSLNIGNDVESDSIRRASK